MLELELKAPVDDPDAVRRRLRDAGAVPGFAGLLADRRWDRGAELSARDEVLRIRTCHGAEPRATLTWKGPTHRSPEGYKAREEIGCEVAGGGEDPARILSALGYQVVHAIDRYVEHWTLDGAVCRLEWYPRMDVLIEVEGSSADLERAAAATGIPRETFTAERLEDFAAHFEARTGRAALLTLDELDGPPDPPWPVQPG